MVGEPNYTLIETKSDNELLFALGRESAGVNAIPQGLETLVERGRELLLKVLPEVKGILCDPEGPRAVLKELSGQSLHQAVTIALGAAATGLTTAACAYVAALILRRGLDRYCELPVSAVPAPSHDSNSAKAQS